jgi:hypothetical protein
MLPFAVATIAFVFKVAFIHFVVFIADVGAV